MSTHNVIVCDVGASTIKVGYTATLFPDVKVPCIVGFPNSHNSNLPVLVGDDAVLRVDKQRDKYSFRTPMDTMGKVQDWQLLELLLKHSFETRMGLGDCSIYRLALARPQGMTRTDLECLFAILFRKIGFQSIHMHDSAGLAMYSMGLQTGVVVEAGEGSIQITPLYLGHYMPDLNKQFPIGGRSLTLHLIQLLRLRGYRSLSVGENDLKLAKKAKEKYCYVAVDLQKEERLADETTALEVELDGLLDDAPTAPIVMGRERFEAVEPLFNPSLVGLESRGLADVIFDTIQEADMDCRVAFYKNIVLSGGTSKLPGLQRRLEQELNQRYVRDVLKGDAKRSRKFHIKVHAANSREKLVFEGLSLYAEYTRKQAHWISKADYQAHGVDLFFEEAQG